MKIERSHKNDSIGNMAFSNWTNAKLAHFARRAPAWSECVLLLCSIVHNITQRIVSVPLTLTSNHKHAYCMHATHMVRQPKKDAPFNGESFVPAAAPFGRMAHEWLKPHTRTCTNASRALTMGKCAAKLPHFDNGFIKSTV